jgi:hypothetical protein
LAVACFGSLLINHLHSYCKPVCTPPQAAERLAARHGVWRDIKVTTAFTHS